MRRSGLRLRIRAIPESRYSEAAALHTDLSSIAAVRPAGHIGGVEGFGDTFLIGERRGADGELSVTPMVARPGNFS